MRAVAAGILVCGLAAGCGQPPSETRTAGTPRPAQTPAPAVRSEKTTACNPAATVTITLKDNDDHPKGARCDVLSVVPDPVFACAGGTITWEFDNKCSKGVKPKIGSRKSIYPKHRKNEPLTTTDDHKPSPETVAAGHSVKLESASVDRCAKDGRYKYDIAGSLDTDPEIDVRRGPRTDCPSPSPEPLLSPSSAPGPSRKR